MLNGVFTKNIIIDNFTHAYSVGFYHNNKEEGLFKIFSRKEKEIIQEINFVDGKKH
jgi:hypothetical protein